MVLIKYFWIFEILNKLKETTNHFKIDASPLELILHVLRIYFFNDILIFYCNHLWQKFNTEPCQGDIKVYLPPIFFFSWPCKRPADWFSWH